MPTGAPVRQAVDDLYPVAVWYYVRNYVPNDDAQARKVMAGEFAHLRSLGFNTIVADAIEDQRRELVLDVAEEQSIRVILPFSRTFAYVRGLQSDRGGPTEAESIVRANVEQVGRHPALYMHYIYDAPTPDLAGRLGEIARLYGMDDPAHPAFVVLSRDVASIANRADLPMVLWDNFPVGEGAPPGDLRNRRYDAPAMHAEALAEIYAQTPNRKHWAMIQALAMPGRLRMPTPAEWDVMHLSALAAGFVDGVVFYRYHMDQDPDSGLGSATRVMPGQRIAAVRKVTKRARDWGPMLRGTRPSRQVVRSNEGALASVLLVGGKRRFLLVYNLDVETFGYDTVYVPTMVDSHAVVRAVNVDEPERFQQVGTAAEIPIQLRLRPGQGHLFELFGP
jgi:hypothetical protein